VFGDICAIVGAATGHVPQFDSIVARSPPFTRVSSLMSPAQDCACAAGAEANAAAKASPKTMVAVEDRMSE
jgi:hypothetical protein